VERYDRGGLLQSLEKLSEALRDSACQGSSVDCAGGKQ
jgi:hypothetical protein